MLVIMRYIVITTHHQLNPLKPVALAINVARSTAPISGTMKNKVHSIATAPIYPNTSSQSIINHYPYQFQ